MELEERPSGPPTARVLEIIRCPAKGGLRGLISSPKVLGKYVHYWGGRTVPCGDSLCAACDDNASRRWKGYVGLLLPNGGGHKIVELTQQACEEIWRWQEANGSILGMKLSLARRANTVNGKVLVQIDRVDRGTYQMPPPPDLSKNLRIIWGLDPREGLAPATQHDAQTLAGTIVPTVINGQHQPANPEANGHIQSRRPRRPDDVHE